MRHLSSRIAKLAIAGAFLLSFAGHESFAAGNGTKVKLQAVLLGGGKPLKDQVVWTVVKPASAGASQQVVYQQTASTGQVDLPPGDYEVTAALGPAKGFQKINVANKPVTANIPLNAAKISFALIPHIGAKPVTTPVTWDIYFYKKGGDGLGTKVASLTGAKPGVTLPAGHYVVRSIYEGVPADTVIPLRAGESLNYTINFYAGKVKPSVKDAAGKAVSGSIDWQVVDAKPGVDGKRKVVLTASQPAKDMTLREGRYILIAKSGALAGEVPVEISAGKTSSVSIVLK